jgi:hypothetical protein
MSVALITSGPNSYLTHIGAANSFFTGITNPSELGNIASTVGANQLAEMYGDTVAMQWTGPVTPQVIPSIDTTGQFVVVNNFTAVNSLGADYQCRRGASVITSAGKIQLAISTNNGYPAPNDARWCIYYPSEDFNQEVLSIEYVTTEANDIMQGNNIAKLVELTGRMKNFSGNNGPVTQGTAAVDLYDDNLSIFAKGCVVTWETGATAGDAWIVAPTP